jgi:formiminoglutamase
MSGLFDLTSRPDNSLFYAGYDSNDPRMGQIVTYADEDYLNADIVIVGCPQDEGVTRNGGRAGAAAAPAAVRRQFYKLSTMNIKKRIFDLGDVRIGASLEITHDTQQAVITQLLRDGKRVIIVGGGNDISYPDGCAMADVFGPEWWIGVNVDSHLDVRIAEQRNSGTPYRQLLEGGHLLPTYFYVVGFQSHFCSPVYYEFIRNLSVHRISLELLRSRSEPDIELKEQIREKFIGHSSSLNTFFGFDMDAVRMSDAPGTSAPSPLGLTASEFIQLVKYAASLANTKVIEFTEVNPEFDIDDRTTRLVAIGMHRFCSGVA